MVVLAMCGLFAVRVPVEAAANQVVINEVDCHGNDWIELFNTSVSSVDLSGWGLSDKDPSLSSARHTYVFPLGTLLAGKSYLVVQQTGLGNQQLTFGVPCAGGESIWLSKPLTPTTFESVSQIPVPSLGSGLTYGRVPNGTGSFQPTHRTKGKSNISALPKLLGTAVHICTAGKMCMVQLRATNAGGFSLVKPVKGVSITAHSALKFGARKRGTYVLWLNVKNVAGVQKVRLTFKVK
mgnify:CR=1 FL=1